MKKIYSCLSLLMFLLALTPVKAQDSKTVLASVGEAITTLDALTVGEHKLVVYNNGRTAYLYDHAENEVPRITSTTDSMTMASAGYVWIVNVSANDGTKATATFKSAKTEGYMPRIPRGANTTKLTTIRDSIETFEITLADGFFLIRGMNSGTADYPDMYFNGNALAADNNTWGYFTGWSATGGNSNHLFYVANTAEINYYPITITMTDENSFNKDTIVNVQIGDTLPIPTVPLFTPISLMDLDGEMREGADIFNYVPEYEGAVTVMYEAYPTITFVCTSDDGKIDTTITRQVAKGDTIALPSFILYTLTTTGYDNHVSAGDETINLSYAYTLPFVPTTVTSGQFAADTKWYAMKIRDVRYISYHEGTSRYASVSSVTNLTDSLLWAFVDEGDGSFKIYNKAAGPSMILWSEAPTTASGDFPLMAVEDTILSENKSYILAANNNATIPGYSWRLKGTDLGYLNDVNSGLGYWTSANSPHDGGSSFAFISADEIKRQADSIRTAEIITTALLYSRAEGVVNGWTADQLTNIKAAHAAQDTTAINAAIAELEAATRIAFDPNQTYAIESAFLGFIEQQPGKTKAIYAATEEVEATDTTEAYTKYFAAWKDYVETPNEEFAWIITKVEGGGDSVVYIKSNQYERYMSAYVWGSRDTLSTEINDSSDYVMFESQAAPASYHFRVDYTKINVNTTTGEETPAAEGAALCIKNGTGGGELEADEIKTYKAYHNRGIGNYWYLRPITVNVQSISSATAGSEEGTNVYYDLTGRRVDNPVKGGIYVTKGKKVVVK